jgi:hypothetical protein
MPIYVSEIKGNKFANVISSLLNITDAEKVCMDIKKGWKLAYLIPWERYEKLKKLKAGFGGLPEEVESNIPSSFTL